MKIRLLLIMTALTLSLYGKSIEYTKGLQAENDMEYSLAIKHYRRAIKHNSYPAMVRLGYIYMTGRGVPHSRSTALWLYKKAAKHGYPPALCKLGDAYIYDIIDPDTINYKAAYHYYKKAADKGYTPAMVELAIMYENGYYVQEDPKKAMMYYRRASNKGNGAATYALGYIYDAGEYMKHDAKKAIYYYKKAMKQGYKIDEMILDDLKDEVE